MSDINSGVDRKMGVGAGMKFGRPGDEALVLQAARAFERERPWAQHRPVVA
jgi:Asp-tRNA(Asn)/Glu-tRNA(Gln) amidotransferase A subunit family amidase